MDFRDVLHAVRYGWWLLLSGILLGLLIAAGLSWAATPLYSSPTQFFVDATDRADIDAAHQGDLYAQERSSSYAAVLRSEQLAGRVVDELGLDLTASQVARKITAIAEPNTVVIDVTVTDSSPARARDIAAALGRQFTLWVSDAESSVGSVTSRAQVTTVLTPELPTRPVSPDVGLALGLGGALGFLLGLGLTVQRHRPWNRVTTEADVRHLAGVPLIGAVPGTPPSGWGHVAVPEHTPAVRAIRGIQANLRLLDAGGAPCVVVITGAVPQDGASILAHSLADALALAGGRVALVEADLRRTERALSLGPVGRAGLADVLVGAATLPEVTQDARDGRLSVVPAGAAPAHPGRLLGSPQMRAVLDSLLSEHDHVIVHAPSVRSSTDATILGLLADRCLLAVRYGRTRRERLAEAAGALSRGGVALLGVVLTQVPRAATVVLSPSYRYQADSDRAAVVAMRRAVMASPDPVARAGDGS